MKKNTIRILLCLAIFIFSSSLTSFAGTWQPAGGDWKYQKDDGSYVVNAWIEDKGASYYFNTDGIMLKNTISPDGYALGRDGKRIFYSETLPNAYWGNEAEFVVIYDAYMDFSNGYHDSFNSAYNEIYPGIISYDETINFENARNSINRLDAFDFTPYMSSDNIIIRKQATGNEIFRIEQVYYLSQILKAIEQKDYDAYSEMCNKSYLSAMKQYDNIDDCINNMIIWNNAY